MTKGECVDASLIHRATKTLDRLRKARATIVTAESCTAGLISAVLSQVDGASEILHGGFIAYTKAEKIAALGVSAQLLSAQGSVNEAVVEALARGALARSAANIAVAVSGVLGPEPDEDGNPVGLVCFCVASRDGHSTVLRKEFGALPHDTLRRATIVTALDVVEEHLPGESE